MRNHLERICMDKGLEFAWKAIVAFWICTSPWLLTMTGSTLSTGATYEIDSWSEAHINSKVCEVPETLRGNSDGIDRLAERIPDPVHVDWNWLHTSMAECNWQTMYIVQSLNKFVGFEQTSKTLSLSQHQACQLLPGELGLICFVYQHHDVTCPAGIYIYGTNRHQ